MDPPWNDQEDQGGKHQCETERLKCQWRYRERRKAQEREPEEDPTEQLGEMCLSATRELTQ